MNNRIHEPLTGNEKYRRFFIYFSIFILALSVRLIYLYQSSDNPSFTAPIIDARTYDLAARKLVAGKEIDFELFWQGCFYPLYLSTVYFLTGSSIVIARILGCVLGTVTCMLIYRLGEKVFDRKIAILSALIASIYGPMIFYQSELLATGWGIFWGVLLVLMFINAASSGKVLHFFLLGLCGALSIITRATFLPFFFISSIWLTVSLYRKSRRIVLPILWIAAASAGFLMITLPVAVKNYQVTGNFSAIAANGAFSIYLGNNPNSDETVTARPGPDYNRLLLLPREENIHQLWKSSPFYRKKVINYILSDPLDFMKGLFSKTLHFISSREIPNSDNLYLCSRWSSLLKLLTWKIGGFGFPFGIAFPLAVLGLIYYWKKTPAPLIIFILLYPLSVIIVHVCARYRMPALGPVLILSATGCIALGKMILAKQWKYIAVIFCCGAASIAICSLPGPFPLEKISYEAELYCSAGEYRQKQGKNDEAISLFEKALQADPEHALSHNNLGYALHSKGKVNEAMVHFRRSIESKPYYSKAHNNLGAALLKQGKITQAITSFDQSISNDPWYTPAFINLGIALKKQGKVDKAVTAWQKALAVKQDSVDAHKNLGNTYLQSGKFVRAVAHFSAVVRSDPEQIQTANNLAWLLATQKISEVYDPQKAIEYARRVCEVTNYENPNYLDTLAVSLAAAGNFTEAIKTAQKAAELAQPKEYSQLKREIQDRLLLYKSHKPYHEPVISEANNAP